MKKNDASKNEASLEVNSISKEKVQPVPFPKESKTIIFSKPECVPNKNVMIGSVSAGIVGGALTGVSGGLPGVVAGAVSGGALAAVGVSISDSLDIENCLAQKAQEQAEKAEKEIREWEEMIFNYINQDPVKNKAFGMEMYKKHYPDRYSEYVKMHPEPVKEEEIDPREKLIRDWENKIIDQAKRNPSFKMPCMHQYKKAYPDRYAAYIKANPDMALPEFQSVPNQSPLSHYIAVRRK